MLLKRNRGHVVVVSAVSVYSLGEPELDLVLGRVGGVGAVADVASHPAVGIHPVPFHFIHGMDRGKGKVS